MLKNDNMLNNNINNKSFTRWKSQFLVCLHYIITYVIWAKLEASTNVIKGGFIL